MAESQKMKRFQNASALFVLAVTGIMGIAFVSRPDTAQVIEVTPLDQGDVAYTPDFGTPAAIQCELPCVINIYGYTDLEGTALLMAELGAFGVPETPTPIATIPLVATPTAVADGPTLTPTIERVIGYYYFTGTTYQHIRQAPVSTAVSVGRVYPNQRVDIVSVVTLSSGDMWLALGNGRYLAYRVNGYQFGSFTQIVN